MAEILVVFNFSIFVVFLQLTALVPFITNLLSLSGDPEKGREFMKFKELLSVIPRSEVFELRTRDEFFGAFRKIDTNAFVEHLDDVVFMISADSSVLQIILI